MSNEEIFWEWFKANNAKYFFLNQMTDMEEKEVLLDDFLKHLHNYCEKLYFEIGGAPNEPQELIITAESNVEYFDKVEALVGKAPQINDWQIIPFKPPMGVDFITEYKGIKFDPHKMWFMPLRDESTPGWLGLKISFSQFDPKNTTVLLTGCCQVLDVILGEKFVALHIQHLEIGKLPKIPEAEG